MNCPKVTVLICTNIISLEFWDSIRSACLQDYPNLEVAVYLDGFIDATAVMEAVNLFCSKLNRIAHISFSLHNVGLTSGLVKLQSCAKSDFYARLDVGDSWAASKISLQVDYCIIESLSIIGTRAIYLSNQRQEGFSANLPNNSSQLIQRIKLFRGLYLHPSILFDAKYTYDPRWYYSQDMKLYVDIANSGGKFGFIDKPLTMISVSPTGITIRKRPIQLYFERKARLLLGNPHSDYIHVKNIAEIREPPSIFPVFYSKFINAAQSGRKCLALAYLILSCLSDLRLLSYYIDRVKANVFYSNGETM